MKAVSVTEFKSHCVKLLEDAKQTGECIEIYRRGKKIATVVPEEPSIEYKPGMFKDSVKIVGDILVDGKDLGIDWEALS